MVTEMGLLVYGAKVLRKRGSKGATRMKCSMASAQWTLAFRILAGFVRDTRGARPLRQFHEPHHPREPRHHGSPWSGNAPAAWTERRPCSFAPAHDDPCQLRAPASLRPRRASVNRLAWIVAS